MESSTVSKTLSQPEKAKRPGILGLNEGLNRDVLLVTGSLIGLFLLWELVARSGVVPKVILPSPIDVAVALWAVLTSSYLPEHLWITTAETISGFFIGCALGILIGILVANIAWFRTIAYPYIIAFQIVPKVVLAPIFITWLGFGMESKIVMTAAIVFFPVVVNTILGLESVEENAKLLMISLEADRMQIFSKLAWPTALPAVFAGLETSATIALIGSIVAEFISAQKGLGVLLISFGYQLKTDYVFAVIIIISLVGLLMFWAVGYLKRKIVFW